MSLATRHFFAIFALICAFGIASAAPPKLPPLTGPEKAEAQRIRKKLFPLRKTVESNFFCPDCHNSKAKVIATPSKDVPKGFIEQKEIVCPHCRGKGVLIDRAFYSALSQYYQLVAAAPDSVKPRLEDPPTMARWVINHATEPWILDTLSGGSMNSSTRIVTARIVDFYRHRTEPRWAVALVELTSAEGDHGPPAMLIFPTGLYPFSDEQSMSGYARLIAVAYKEPAPKRWEETSQGALAEEQALYPNLESAPDIDRAMIEALHRVIAWLSAAHNVMTVVDCVSEPTRFHSQATAARELAQPHKGTATPATRRPVKAIRS